MYVLMLDHVSSGRASDMTNSPKVDETKDQPGYHGKVGKVESHTCSRCNGKGDVVSRSDGSIERDCAGDDNVAEGASGYQLMSQACR